MLHWDRIRTRADSFFLLGAPQAKGTTPSPAYVTDFPTTSALIKAFMQIKDAKLRRRIVDLVEGIADQ
ncbi:MAG: hypothetical protein QOI12_942 [Alphaproteobacteria bacterium]|jgi:hypothetical protein|nr:hypothetical protein [Alphaproteobacteria bacterium]